MILTYEAAEDGTFCLRSDSGYLHTGQNGYTLNYGEKDEYSLWKTGENNTLISCSAVSAETAEHRPDMDTVFRFLKHLTSTDILPQRRME